jgi:hypothetical protein
VAVTGSACLISNLDRNQRKRMAATIAGVTSIHRPRQSTPRSPFTSHLQKSSQSRLPALTLWLRMEWLCLPDDRKITPLLSLKRRARSPSSGMSTHGWPACAIRLSLHPLKFSNGAIRRRRSAGGACERFRQVSGLTGFADLQRDRTLHGAATKELCSRWPAARDRTGGMV